MKNINIFFTGTAGSGKSTLTYAFQNWMNTAGLDVVTINLDPGVDNLPYKPDIDVREWISLTQLMREHKLGPNGAQIAAADLVVFNIDRIQDLINEFKTNYILFDTPGQTELFTFRHASTRIIEKLGIDRSAFIFLVDPFIAQTPTGFVSEILLAATVQFRFSVPLFNVLSKSDMIEQENLDKILEWSNDIFKIEEALMVDQKNLTSQMNLELLRALGDMDIYHELTPTSAETMKGMPDIYNFIQQVFMGGEDLTPD